MSTKSGSANPESPRTPKKRYHGPKLAVYGRLKEITQAVGGQGSSDGGGGMTNKTQR